jgi:putative hydrolase of the HAD superfamily
MNEPTQPSPLRLPPSPLVFDAVGTLIYAAPSPAEVYERVGRRLGSRLSRDEISRRFRAAFAAEEAVDRRDPELRTEEARELRRWQAIVAAVLDDVTDPAAAFDELWRHFARPDAWKPFADAAETLPELVRRDHTIGVASNFDARLHDIIATHFPQIRREHVFVSSQLGIRKPSPNFFRNCSLPTAHCPLFVGDDVDNDFHGAKSAGWQAVLIDRDGRHPEISPRIADLRELLATSSA